MKCRLCGFILSEKKMPPLVHSDVLISRSNKKNTSLIKCPECSLVQVACLSSKELITKLYQELQDDDFEKEIFSRELSFRRDLLIIHEALPFEPKNILEVGAFTGGAQKSIRDIFPKAEIMGIEPSKWAAQLARKKGYNVIEAVVGNDLPVDNKFDLILSWDVIEHLEQPSEFFQWVEKYTSENAFIFLNTPDWNSIWRKIFGKRWWFIIPMHRSYFSRKTLSELGKKYGWNSKLTWRHKKYRSFQYLISRFFPVIGKDFYKNRNFNLDISIPVAPGQFGILFTRNKKAAPEEAAYLIEK